ncbi:MAG TPA: hypothetical protein VHA07_09960 [Devosia sp.]|nr:hypothetical protein [Devosia sp.]
MRDATLSRFVSGIYDAVIDPALWQPAIETIRVEFRFHIAVLAVNKVPSGDGVIFAFCNVPDEYARTLGNYGADIVEAWGGVQAIARLPLEEPLVTSEVRPIQHWKNNRFYLEWMKPQGIVGEVAMILASDRTTNANLGLSVHESRGPIEPEPLRI